MLRCQHPQWDTRWNRRREKTSTLKAPGEWRTLMVPGDISERGFFICMSVRVCVCVYIYIHEHCLVVHVAPEWRWHCATWSLESHLSQWGGEEHGTRLQRAVGMARFGILRNARSSDRSEGATLVEETDGRSGMVPTPVALNDCALLTQLCHLLRCTVEGTTVCL